MDMKFDKVIPEFPQLAINTSTASEHIADIKHHIRVIKEQCHTRMVVMPFKNLPYIMTINMVHLYVFWINVIPVKSGMSSIYSLRELICHQKVDAQKWCRLMFRDYIKTHEKFPLPIL